MSTYSKWMAVIQLLGIVMFMCSVARDGVVLFLGCLWGASVLVTGYFVGRSDEAHATTSRAPARAHSGEGEA